MASIGGLKSLALAAAAAATIIIAEPADRAAAADEKLSPLGVWLAHGDDGGKGHIKIYECGDKLCGKLVWGSQPKARDINNPDESRRDKLLLGQDILTGLEPDGENFWDGGRLYDATTGQTWKCSIKILPGNDELKIRGYFGISLFGQSRIWTRVK